MTDYIIYNLRPFNTVEKPEFRRMVAVLDPAIKIMARRQFMGELGSRASKDRKGTLEMFNNSKYVATAADIWSCSHHGYMGMTASTIDPTTYKRISRAIACKHFENPHSGKRIAELICEVHTTLGLDLDMLVGTITDRGANIIKAFKIGAIDSNVQYLLEELADLKNTLPKHQKCVFDFFLLRNS